MSSNESHWDIQWIVISPVKNLADNENNTHRRERIYGISFRLFNLISHESAQRTQSGLSSWSREEKFRILQATTYYFAYYLNILLTGRSWLNSSFTFIHGAKIERATCQQPIGSTERCDLEHPWKILVMFHFWWYNCSHLWKFLSSTAVYNTKIIIHWENTTKPTYLSGE